jgi:hypothetical protein
MSLPGGTTKQSPRVQCANEGIINVVNYFFKVLMSSLWSVVRAALAMTYLLFV